MNDIDDQRVYRLEEQIGKLATSLAETDRKVDNLVTVCSAVADDTLRMCFILDELNRVGVMPTLPWDLATVLVELHHAMQAEKNGDKDLDGTPMANRIAELKRDILFLRGEYQRSLTAAEEDKVPDEEQPPG